MKDWVVRDTKRPEKRDEQIQDAVNAAVEYATTYCDFAADLSEGSLAISSAVNAQSFSLTAEMPRFRKIKYLKPVDYKRFLKWRDPSRVFDDKGCAAVDVWY